MTGGCCSCQIAPGELVYSDKEWKVFRQGIGMGEVEYAMFLYDEWFAMVPDDYHWNLIIGALRSNE
jgi:hypothetical protein